MLNVVPKIIEIDLAEFGGSGIMEMSTPTLRRITAMRNAIGDCTQMSQVSGSDGVVIDRTRLGDVEIISTLAYVRKAPFRATLDGFLEYGDTLDDKSVGSAQALYNKMVSTVKEIDKGEGSPFVPSPAAEKGTSA